MTADEVWVSAHIFHSGDVDRLLIEAVAPAVDDLVRDRLCESWFFLRYWEGGPHVRVRMRVPERARGTAACLFIDRVRAYLRTNASPRWPTPSEYAAAAADLAAREQMSRWDLALHDPDTVVIADYVPETAKFGIGVDLAAVERHFADSSALALWLIRSSDEPRHRHTAATAAILSGALICLRTGVPFAGTSQGAPTEAARNLAEHVATTLQTPEADRPEGFVKEWIATVERLHARFNARSPLRAGMLVDYCGHLLCNRLGVSPAQERELRRVVGAALGAAPPTAQRRTAEVGG